MSWIFAFVAKKKKSNSGTYRFSLSAAYEYSDEETYIAVGGNANTIAFVPPQHDEPFLAVVGLPMNETGTEFIKGKRLRGEVAAFVSGKTLLNGHFCGCTRRGDMLVFFTDPLGLREWHVVEKEEGWYWSTRPDMLFSLTGREINASAFGGRWLLLNQLTTESVVSGIERLAAGKQALLHNGTMEIRDQAFIPPIDGDFQEEEFRNRLSAIVRAGIHRGKTLSLSLSGGMDSRLLLALLLGSGDKSWGSHTLQHEYDCDSDIASRIAQDLQFSCEIIRQSPTPFDILLSETTGYVGTTYIVQSAFHSRTLLHYGSMPPKDLIIDGGFGEIWRREFLTRLHWQKNNVLEQNVEALTQALRHHRADLFNADFTAEMNSGATEQVAALCRILPTPPSIGIGKWLDLFSLKTRLPNFYGQEQSRADAYAQTFMPFVQPALLHSLLTMPDTLKRNSHLFRSCIAAHSPILQQYPIAKGNIKVPYFLTSFQKKLWVKMANLLRQTPSLHPMDTYLQQWREYALDLIGSAEVREYPLYNYKAIAKAVTAYYNGSQEQRSTVDWFLTFDLFRQLLQGRSKTTSEIAKFTN